MFPQYSIHRCNIMINQRICDNSGIPYDIYIIFIERYIQIILMIFIIDVN